MRIEETRKNRSFILTTVPFTGPLVLQLTTFYIGLFTFGTATHSTGFPHPINKSYKTCYLEYSQSTKNCSRKQELEIARSKLLY